MIDDFHPTASTVEDSVSEEGHRVTTIEVTLHRWVLAELNTHRTFSRNSASSRAIPARKAVDRVLGTAVYPLVWPAERKGMQGGAPLDDKTALRAGAVWRRARSAAVAAAEELAGLGVHKSVVNRLLEPFMTQTVVITATDWQGFFRQRCSPLAQEELRVAAEAIRQVRDGSSPRLVRYGQWHMPYLTEDERSGLDVQVGREISAARCARVSYLTHHGVRDLSADRALSTRLVTADPPHASPLEHVCTPTRLPARGNLRGWRQLRHEAIDE